MGNQYNPNKIFNIDQNLQDGILFDTDAALPLENNSGITEMRDVFNNREVDITELGSEKQEDNLTPDDNLTSNSKLKIYDISGDQNKNRIKYNPLADVEKYKKTQDREALENLMRYLNPTIDKAINTFGNGNRALYPQAKLLVIDAITTYDPKKGDLKTHVLLHLQRLRRITGTTNPVNVPEAIRVLAPQISNAEKELADKYGRPPSDQEIADYLGISLKKIKKVRESINPVPESGVEGIGATTEFGKSMDKQKLEFWMDTIYLDLSPTEQYIMDAYYGRNGRKKQTLEEIAKKLKIPVSTVHAKIKKIEELIQTGEQL